MPTLGLVDLGLSPEMADAKLLSTVTLNVLVEPHGAKITGLGVRLKFDPDQLTVEPGGVTLNPSLDSAIQVVINSQTGIVTLFVTPLSGLPTDGFELASVTFNVQPVGAEVVVSFGQETSVLSNDVDVTGDTSSTSTISIGSFGGLLGLP